MNAPPRNLVRFRCAGMSWTAEAWLAGPLREAVAPHLGELETHGAERIKRSLARTVLRLELGGRVVFLKHHRARSLRETLKYLVLRSRAAAEWETARAMAELGLPVVRAVALGERRIAGVWREAVLVTEAVEGAEPFGSARHRDPELLGRAAHLIRRLHDAGVHHRDLHGGNLLVTVDGLVLLDLHRVRVGGVVSERQRAASVAQFLAALGSGEDERRAFCREYLGPETTGRPADRFAHRVERWVVRHRERRYASRTKRCIKKSTGFRRERARGMTVRRRADFPLESVLAALDAHAAALERGGERVLKHEGRTRVTVVELPGGGPPLLCVKEFSRPGRFQRMGDRFVGSPARRAWVGAHACAVRGIPTPRAFAMVEAGTRSFFLAEYIEGATTLDDYASDFGRPRGREATRRWRDFLRQAADFVRLVHSHRIRHRDLAGKNLLVRERDGAWEFFVIDVSDIRLGVPSFRFKVRNLAELDDTRAKPSRTDRLRFLRHYARGRPEFERRDLPARIDARSRARRKHWLRSGGARILEERKRQGKPI